MQLLCINAYLYIKKNCGLILFVKFDDCFFVFFFFLFLLLVSQLLITYVYDNAQTNLPELVWYDMTWLVMELYYLLFQRLYFCSIMKENIFLIQCMVLFNDTWHYKCSKSLWITLFLKSVLHWAPIICRMICNWYALIFSLFSYLCYDCKYAMVANEIWQLKLGKRISKISLKRKLFNVSINTM